MLSHTVWIPDCIVVTVVTVGSVVSTVGGETTMTGLTVSGMVLLLVLAHGSGKSSELVISVRLSRHWYCWLLKQAEPHWNGAT